jgi:hypothetical protein
MVRTFTSNEQARTAAAQWRAAWALLTDEWQRAIAHFCLQEDRDLAVTVLKIRSA